MAYFSDTYMNNQRRRWLNSIHSVEVLVDGTWHRGEFNRKDIEGDTIVISATFPTLDDKSCTITASRIVDVRGETAAYQNRAIRKNSGQGVMIKITIPVYEVTA